MTATTRADASEPALGSGYDHLTAAYPELTPTEIHEALTGAVRRKHAAAVKLLHMNRRAGQARPGRAVESATVWVAEGNSAYHLSSQCSAITAYCGVDTEAVPTMRALATRRGLELCRWCRAWTEA